MGLHDRKIGVTKSLSTIAITTAIGMCLATPIQAQEVTAAGGKKKAAHQLVIRDVGGAQRVNASSQLGMLSQRISANACILSDGSDAATQADLGAASDEFNEILDGLRSGDDERGIFGGEKSFRIYLYINDVHTMWDPLKVAVNKIESGDDIADSVALVAAENTAVLEQTQFLVSTIASAYSNPAELTGANALLVDFSGRQRILLQQMAKQGCGIITGNSDFGTAEQLAQTISRYEVTLLALKDGRPDAGILSPPTQGIQSDLNGVFANWQGMKSQLSQITGKDSIDQSALLKMFGLLRHSTESMDKITNQYAEFSKSEL